MKNIMFAVLALAVMFLNACTAEKHDDPNVILLKNYRPQPIYNIPKTHVDKAKFPIIDIHTHPYARTKEQIDEWVANMDDVGVEKTIVLSGATGAKFDSIFAMYNDNYPDRFQVWCSFDYSGYDQPGFPESAVVELERCYKVGARGVGELGDKGKGLFYSSPGPKAWGMHPDDPRMDPLWEKCAELNMPVNLHVADPIWMYQPMDSTNDGLMNAYTWRLDNQPGIVDNPGMLVILENTVKKHPNTTFIACHFANQSHDLNALGRLFDLYPNLYADISGRFAETAAIPRFAGQFIEKYHDRLLYGTDMGYNKNMYRITFRILETRDEHFYEIEWFNYHWALSGFGLSNDTLSKLYRENALRVLRK